MVIFYSYVKLPEGTTYPLNLVIKCCWLERLENDLQTKVLCWWENHGKSSINSGFFIAMFDYRRVVVSITFYFPFALTLDDWLWYVPEGWMDQPARMCSPCRIEMNWVVSHMQVYITSHAQTDIYIYIHIYTILYNEALTRMHIQVFGTLRGITGRRVLAIETLVCL